VFGCCDLAHAAAQVSVVLTTNGAADSTTEQATAAVSAVNALSMQINTNSFQIYLTEIYEGWNFNSGNYLFTTDTK